MRRTRSTTAPALTRANKRASLLIEAMLHEMQRGLRNPKKLESVEWTRLFGDKQSMVGNLQKLVQSLAALSDPRGRKTSGASTHPEDAAMSMQDMQILAWMEEDEREAPEA
jgi:hypothetical protein